jgi:hypothetical protein
MRVNLESDGAILMPMRWLIFTTLTPAWISIDACV